jgi:hypothetical protein
VKRLFLAAVVLLTVVSTAHAQAPTAFQNDHYSLLRTIEDAWALGTLGQQDAEASAITEVWRRPHTLTVTSVNPSAVAVTVNPMDLDGLGNGTTTFNRIYDHNALVNLTAPITAQSTTFQQWQRSNSSSPRASPRDATPLRSGTVRT